MINKKTLSEVSPIILMTVVCLALKILCFYVLQRIVYPNDLPLMLLSLTYYVSLGALCFFSRKSSISSAITVSVLNLEILVQLIAVLCKGPAVFGVLYSLIAASGYVLFELINLFEGVGETINNWYYFTAFVVGQLVFVGIVLIGRKKKTGDGSVS